MTDFVALTSVLVTGIVSPAIAAFTVWSQTKHSHTAALQKENREVLDAAAEQLARWIRSAGLTTQLWQRGLYDDQEEVKIAIRERQIADEELRRAYARIVIRFGKESDVAARYAHALDLCQPITDYIKLFRLRHPPNDIPGIKQAFDDMTDANDMFLEVATQAANNFTKIRRRQRKDLQQ